MLERGEGRWAVDIGSLADGFIPKLTGCASWMHRLGSVFAILQKCGCGWWVRKRQGWPHLCFHRGRADSSVAAFKVFQTSLSLQRRPWLNPNQQSQPTWGGLFETTITTRLNHEALIQLIRVNHYGYCGQRHIQIALASAAATGGAAKGTAVAAKLQGKMDFQRGAARRVQKG